jgi:asparagine synthase (glutamine-hydrolysing)
MSAVTSTSVFELQTYLVSTLLRDADQMSMAHGLELRVPLIDSDVIEHVLPISPEEKIRGGVGKRLLFDALKGIVPSEVFARPKRGFTLPFEKWLVRDLQESVGDCFHSANMSGPWDRRNFNRVWIDFSKGRVSWSRVLTLFVVEKWLQENTVSA